MRPIEHPQGEQACLQHLNDAQRRAVLYGDGRVAGPLLVIAGAGTGKTNTLVHRLAHLVLSGADRRRRVLLPRSRREDRERRGAAHDRQREDAGERARWASRGVKGRMIASARTRASGMKCFDEG